MLLFQLKIHKTGVIMEDLAKRELSARKFAMIGWICFLCGFIIPFVPVAAVILGYIGRKDYKGLGYDEQFDALIKTFWVAFTLVIVGIITSIIVIGYFVLLGTTVYVVYKSVRGLIGLNAFSSASWNEKPAVAEEKPLEPASKQPVEEAQVELK